MINKKLKSLRKSQNVSKNQLANYLSVSKKTISSWEKGTSLPNTDAIIKLSDFFKISAYELLDINAESELDLNHISEQLLQINQKISNNNNNKISHIFKKILDIIFAIIIIYIIFIIIFALVTRVRPIGKIDDISIETTETIITE